LPARIRVDEFAYLHEWDIAIAQCPVTGFQHTHLVDLAAPTVKAEQRLKPACRISDFHGRNRISSSLEKVDRIDKASIHQLIAPGKYPGPYMRIKRNAVKFKPLPYLDPPVFPSRDPAVKIEQRMRIGDYDNIGPGIGGVRDIVEIIKILGELVMMDIFSPYRMPPVAVTAVAFDHPRVFIYP